MLRDAAYRWLDGYGDPTAGEWTDASPRAFHLRRRLSAAEQAHVGVALDVRGTSDARQRLRAVPAAILQAVPPEILAAELGATRR